MFKVIQQIIYPLNLALVVLLLGICCLFARRRRAGTWLASFSFVLLLAASLPKAAVHLIAPLENRFAALPLADYTAADAIVVLGGTTSGAAAPGAGPEENSGSRLLTAARLYHLGKASKVLVSGGKSYKTKDRNTRSEADDMSSILVDMGVPQSIILRESNSQSTEQNAFYSAEIIRQNGWQRVLLVSSAHHLRRAVFWFEQAGVSTIPVPAGRLAWCTSGCLLSYLPSASALLRSTAAIKEYGGFAWARLKTTVRGNQSLRP